MAAISAILIVVTAKTAGAIVRELTFKILSI
jgi:hypothetical protein